MNVGTAAIGCPSGEAAHPPLSSNLNGLTILQSFLQNPRFSQQIERGNQIILSRFSRGQLYSNR
jgi:hypothetical protein